MWSDIILWANHCPFDVAGSEVVAGGEIVLYCNSVQIAEWGGERVVDKGWLVEVVGESQ